MLTKGGIIEKNVGQTLFPPCFPMTIMEHSFSWMQKHPFPLSSWQWFKMVWNNISLGHTHKALPLHGCYKKLTCSWPKLFCLILILLVLSLPYCTIKTFYILLGNDIQHYLFVIVLCCCFFLFFFFMKIINLSRLKKIFTKPLLHISLLRVDFCSGKCIRSI